MDFSPRTPLPAAPPPVVYAFERGLWNMAWFIIVLCLVFAAVDWEMVSLLVFPFVFIFPAMLAAWNRSLWFALVCSSGLSITRVAHELVFDPKPVSVIDTTDALIQFFVLVLLAALTSLLGRQSRQLRQRVQALEGLLPICSHCKSIRDGQGNWVPVERFIASRSQAQFSHGLCPTCTKQYFGFVEAKH